MKKKKGHIFSHNRHGDIKGKHYDTYLRQDHYSDPTICSECGALFTNGRWSWEDLPNEASEAICPACQRQHDHYPAGFIMLRGNFYFQNEQEILNLIRNVASLEQSLHPLERIMDIEFTPHHTSITTTGTHIARRLGDALESAYMGELGYTYEGDNFVRIHWQR